MRDFLFGTLHPVYSVQCAGTWYWVNVRMRIVRLAAYMFFTSVVVWSLVGFVLAYRLVFGG